MSEYTKDALLNRRDAVSMQHRVNPFVKLKLELLTYLLPARLLDSLQDIIEHAKAGGILIVVPFALVHAGAHQAGVPAIYAPANNVRHQIVANHVDVAWKALAIVDPLHPTGDDLVRVLVCG